MPLSESCKYRECSAECIKLLRVEMVEVDIDGEVVPGIVKLALEDLDSNGEL